MSEADKIIKNLKNSGKKVEEFYVSNKTSDKNVANIEEAIKILEKDLFYYDEIKENFDDDTIKFYEALRHILSDYTRQKQINEEHQKINGELREKVKELDTKNDELLKDLYSANCIISDLIDSIPKQKIKNKIEELKQDKESKYYDSFLEERDIEKTIEFLQELLQEEAKNEL